MVPAWAHARLGDTLMTQQKFVKAYVHSVKWGRTKPENVRTLVTLQISIWTPPIEYARTVRAPAQPAAGRFRQIA